MKRLKLFFACLLMAVLSIGQMWAGDVLAYTIELKPTTTNTTARTTSNFVSDLVTAGSEYISGCTSTACSYPNGGYVKLGSSSAAGKFTLSLSTAGQVKATKVVLSVKAQDSGKTIKLTANSTSETFSPTSSFADYELTLDGTADLTTIAVENVTANKGRMNVDAIKVYIADGGGSTPSLSVSPAVIDFGTVDQNAVVANKTVAVTFENLTGSVTYDGLSGAFSASGSISASGDQITIAANTATVGNYSQTLTVQSTADSKSQDVTVKMNVVEPFDGLKLTFDVSSNPGEWPTTNSTTTTNYTYTLNDVDYTFALNNVKCNSGYLMLYYVAKLGLPAISGYKLVKVEATNSSGCSTSTKVKITEDEAGSTVVSGGAEQTWSTTSTKYTYELSNTEAETMYYLYVSNKNCQIVTLELYYEEVEAPLLPKAAKPTFETGDENFVTSTSVTLSCTTEGASIYYTTNGDVPTSGSTLYEGAIPVSSTTTIKAIAVADGYDNSLMAEKTFTQVTALESLTALLDATVSAETAFNVVIDNWVVTGVNGTRAWIADAANEKGILLYKSGHSFVAGNKLNGVVLGTKTKLYQGYPEMTTLVSTDVTVTTAEAITPRTTTIAALTSGYYNEQGTIVKLENVTYTSSALSDGVNSIAADNKLFSSLALVEGTTYDITGVVEYLDGSVVKIMPRSIDDVVAKSAVVTPTAANLAALKAADRGTYILTLENAVVTYVNGNNAFIEDATGGALIYFASHGYSAGDCLNGDYQVTTTDYQGKFEITAVEPQVGAATTTAEIPLTTVTITALNANFGSYESRRVKIVGANVTDAIKNTDRNGAINDGAALAVYAAVASTITLTADDNVDIIGYPGFHNTDQQLNVWRQEDITVNVKEDPELAYNPTEVNVLLSDLASFTPAVLEYATGFDGVAAITYESSDPSIATVETDGTVTLVAPAEGSTTITASFAGNATYKADNASYTINVSAAPIAPVYTMSFDMTRASYDAAADAQVVWNSSVVTMTANKNDGTKVTNYLAGNYTGTTLIAETRLYAKNSISFVPQAGVTITKIEWMSTAKGYATKLAAETFVNATAVVDGTDDKLVIITPSAAGEISVTLTDAARATGVTVYYEAESEKAKLAASIAIADINMAVGDDDILLSDIAATSNPNKKAISYAVTSGTAVSLVGEGKDAAFHAVEAGTATITATIPNDLGNYTGATQTFDIIVSAGPATLESIAISGTASVLEYTEGQDFNPAGLVVTGHYSDNTDAEISEGITWAFDPSPLTAGTTSVSVTATVSEITSDAFVVNGLTVSAAPAPTSGNVVILAEYNSKFYVMSNSLGNGALAGVEVEKDGSKIVVSSAEDKAAIQWTATVDGDNTTLKDANDYYIKGSSGASLSLETDPYNWNWDGEKSCYISSAYTNRGLFFSNSGNVFKGYALSNITSDGYAATEVIEIDPEDIVISSKVDPELAYTPASDEITAGDAWSAPTLGYVEGFDGLTAITYESSNEAVATVTNEGIIALAGATGTATITATFGGNASYLAGSATYTVKVNEPAEDCDGTDDFLDTEDKGNPTSYKDRSTPNGWSAVNAGYKVIDEKAYWMINGKTTAVGVITSPELTGGLGTLKFRYANTNSESNGVSVKIEIKQGGDVVKEYTLTKANSEVVQNTVYTETIENINVAGNFQIVITNLSPSNNTGNKDRVSIGRFCWTGYTAPEPQYVTVRENLDANRYYTICLEKNITDFKGATFWNLTYKNEGNTEVYLVEADQLEAGKPYIFQATGDNEGKLEVMYGSEEANAPVENGALRGTFEDIDVTEFANLEGTVYLLINNAIRPRTSGNYLNAHRAYVRYDLLTVPQTQNFAPGKRVRAIPMQQNTATGMENVQGDNVQCTKVLINGQLFILRGEKMYDAKGQLVK